MTRGSLSRYVVAHYAVALIVAGLCLPAAGFFDSGSTAFKWGEDAFKSSDYKQALVYYQLYLNQQKDNQFNQRVEQANVRRGECLFYIGDYQKALVVFRDYLTFYNRGRHYATVRAVLEMMDERAREESEQRRAQREQALTHIRAVEERMGENPTLEQRAMLMELYWRAGEYRNALGEYDSIIQHDAEFFQQTHVNYVVPELISSAQPSASSMLRVLGVSKRVEFDNNFLGNRRTLVVDGMIHNEGRKALHDVEFDVAIHDFFGRLIDSRVARVGTVPPKGNRPVILRFDGFDDNFQNVYNVERVVFQLADVREEEEALRP